MPVRRTEKAVRACKECQASEYRVCQECHEAEVYGRPLNPAWREWLADKQKAPGKGSL